MRRFFLMATLSFGALTAAAQEIVVRENSITDEGRAPYRTEFISYDIRKEADTGMEQGSKYFRRLAFKPETSVGGATIFETVVDIPELWLDREIYIRDTGRTGRYALVVNGQTVGLNTDSYGTNDYYLTPSLRSGENTIMLAFSDEVEGAEMEKFTATSGRKIIENLYIWSQPRIYIFDYTVSGHFDEDIKDQAIDLEVIVVNGHNFEEKVTVGFDIYDPDGKLTEAVFKYDVAIPGRGCDTLRFMNKIVGADKFHYTTRNPALYRVMLSLRHEGRNIEYIPFRFGFGLTAFDGKTVSRSGSPVVIKAIEADFPVRAGAAEKLRAWKKQGYNTVSVIRPQGKWFYDMCLQEGFYVIDRAAVECDPRGGNRGPNGTVVNAPALLNRFLDRQQAMFYRRRNYTNVVGWGTGSESGNGYNMYKSYRLLKSLDATRPIIYPWAEDEWNTDTF